ncbi:hypothetical protein FRZ44_14920 [Hypericibacter terrae]|uniref:Alpha/beta hydrolase n=2 Tax=Hypericibacter terrae TaxID=2602015 RepID=A0A5J6MIT8_9PROT|nr:hypothetical protein FRZ44_14920 [Hypericibacter terrae]
MARPWFDWVALHLGIRIYMPLSRAWAAALDAEGSTERFRLEIGCDLPEKAVPKRALAKVTKLKATFKAVDAAWLDSFFGARDAGQAELLRAKEAWLKTSLDLMRARSLFWPLMLRHKIPAARFHIPSIDEVEAAYAGFRSDPDKAFALPSPLPTVERSRVIEHSWCREYWLRFASPGPDRDTCWAHVVEPLASENVPSLIDGNGLMVEPESYGAMINSQAGLIARGIRVISMEAPWHVRRRPQGWYGGERFIATQPLGALELFSTGAREMGIVAGWCRQQGRGRVAFGGTSMGALTAQLAAARARAWSERHRPDVLFLVTTSDSVSALAVESSISRQVGLPQALHEAGWSEANLNAFAGLTDPGLIAPLPPSNIIMVLGRADTVTPCKRGASLAEHWNLPGRNLFLYNRGHFTVPIGMFRDQEPVERLAERLQLKTTVSLREIQLKLAAAPQQQPKTP